MVSVKEAPSGHSALNSVAPHLTATTATFPGLPGDALLANELVLFTYKTDRRMI